MHKQSFRILAKDVFVSNDTHITGLCNNDLIIGPSGSGKTGGYVIPNLLLSDQSMVVIDTKGMLYRRYGDYLKHKGFVVRFLDFKAPDKAADTYNPLDYIRQKPVSEVIDGKNSWARSPASHHTAHTRSCSRCAAWQSGSRSGCWPGQRSWCWSQAW